MRPTGFNTQPPEGGWAAGGRDVMLGNVSTHSRPKAAGIAGLMTNLGYLFQHTAARRRLVPHPLRRRLQPMVSTHSRPKAAGNRPPPIFPATGRFQHTAARRRLGKIRLQARLSNLSFNTQPPEGGWLPKRDLSLKIVVSTHSRPKAAGKTKTPSSTTASCFNTQPPEGGWPYQQTLL